LLDRKGDGIEEGLRIADMHTPRGKSPGNPV
jgi:hypothetical protein